MFLVYLIWNLEGVFVKMGVFDFLGGMVVYLFVGFFLYILVYVIGKSEY